MELDGGQHMDNEAITYDEQREAKLSELGIRTLRFSNVEVLKDTDAVVSGILRYLEQNPHPTLSRSTGRGSTQSA